MKDIPGQFSSNSRCLERNDNQRDQNINTDPRAQWPEWLIEHYVKTMLSEG